MSKRKKSIIGVYIGALVLLIVVIVGYFIIPIKLKPLLEDEISKALSADHEGLYQVQVSELALTEFWSELRLKGVSISPDTTKLNQLDSAQVPAMMFQVKIEDFSISAGGFVALALGNKKIQFSECIVDSVDLQLWSNPHAQKTEDKKPKERNIRFKDLQFRHINADYREWPAIDSSIGSLNSAWFNGGLQLEQMSDRMSMKVDDQLVEWGVSELAVFVPGGLYQLKTDSLRQNSDSARFAAHGFRVVPLYDKNAFQQHLTEQSDRIDCEVQLVQIDSVDWNALLNGGHFMAHSVFINSVRLEAYRDRAVPFNESRRPDLPTELLRDLPVQVDLKELELSDADIEYREKPEDSEEAAVIAFNQLNAKFHNITNQKALLEKDSLMTIHARTNLWNGPLLSAKFTYNLLDTNGYYSIAGQLDDFDFALLTEPVEVLTGMYINKGSHSHTEIELSGNDYVTTGEVVMKYSDLEIDTDPDQSDLSKLVSRFTSKSLLYYKHNPQKGELRTGKIEFERDPSRFVFNYWWKSYFDGVKSAVLRPGSEE